MRAVERERERAITTERAEECFSKTNGSNNPQKKILKYTIVPVRFKGQ